MSTAPAPLIAATLLIGDESLSTSTSQPIISPNDGTQVGTCAQGTDAHVDQAVAQAHAAWLLWRDQPAPTREKIMRTASAHVRSQAPRIATIMAQEQGKPYAQSLSEVTGSCDCLDYYASEAVRIIGEVLPTEKASMRSFVLRQSVGVVAAITPWNYPVALLAWKLGPALAAGCPVIVKPTPVTPLSPWAFCHALIAGGLPPGLVQFMTGSDTEVAQPLVNHPGVAKIAFTGSTATGRKLMAAAGPSFKKITLEMGGQCPAIVLPDADLERTATAIAYKAFRNMGQSCSTINRIYVHASIHDQLVDLVCAKAEATSIGHAVSNPKVDIGPMTTRASRANVIAHVADALKMGAELRSGGRIPTDQPDKGHYYQPTVLTGMTPAMLVAREETFGPVAPFASFTDTDAAIASANTSDYGLCGFLFTDSLKQAMTVAERMDVGTVCINNVAVNTPYAPYEGWKASGVGVELSRDAIGEYLHRKHVKLEL